MKLEIDLNVESKKWPKDTILKEKVMFTRLALATLEAVEATKLCKILNFSMLFISDEEMIGYNWKFRNKNSPTNVLSFPAEDFSREELLEFKMEHLYLGEIIFSFETIKKESEAQHKTFEDHLRHLFVHAFLHLLCYEHDDEYDRVEMEQLEISILAGFGIKNPYEVEL
jgi:probable rRNA maturation factor